MYSSEVVVSSSSEATSVRVTNFSSSKYVVLLRNVYGAHVKAAAQSSDPDLDKTLLLHRRSRRLITRWAFWMIKVDARFIYSSL